MLRLVKKEGSALLCRYSVITHLSSIAADPNAEDIIDEAITLFRANCLFRNFEIKGNADRVLIYLILFISECLGKINKNMPQSDAQKQLSTLAVSQFAIPGDPNFPLNAMYAPPADRYQAGKRLTRYISLSLCVHLQKALKPPFARSNATIYTAIASGTGQSVGRDGICRW